MDQHVVITGASSGIGAALAREFLGHGARTTLVARRRARLAQVAADWSSQAHLVACDLGDRDANLKWVAPATRKFGPIDVLVNNAGMQVIGDMATLDPRQGERALDLNLAYPLRLIQRVLPVMLERGRGHIVNVASIAAFAPTPHMCFYNASKAGLAAASESLRGELLKTQVKVTTVYPGIVPDTEMGRRGLEMYEGGRLVDLQPTVTAEALAKAVHRAVVRGQARVIFPRVNGLLRHLPNATRFLLDRLTPPLRQ